ncbi:MAG TPA: alanine racemase, partial [Chryseolinea sp.]|nr:alanine racemase [Chryseolinea sp.]
SCLIDNRQSAKALSKVCASYNISLEVFIDLNVGMNRTGIDPTHAILLIEDCENLPGIKVKGLHGYDGHIRDKDLALRKKNCDASFEAVIHLQRQVKDKFNKDLVIVAGGTPTYPIHSARKDVECSPGTLIYWDQGYADILAEQHYLFAALVLTRVISKPGPGIICVDLGHKAIASENPITSRVTFLNAPDLMPTGHSEEHMVLNFNGPDHYAVGDVLFGVPFHICPTVALHDRPAVVEHNEVVGYWHTISRNRLITV